MRIIIHNPSKQAMHIFVNQQIDNVTLTDREYNSSIDDRRRTTNRQHALTNEVKIANDKLRHGKDDLVLDVARQFFWIAT